MATNFNAMPQQSNPLQQMPMQMPMQFPAQQYFPQPQGNIYMLNSSSEAGTIPIGGGLSAGICLSEGCMYLKTLQNGAPVMLSYHLSPLETHTDGAPQSDTNKKISDFLKSYDERLSKIESLIQSSKGGKLEWPL